MATIGITRGGDLPDNGAKSDLHNLVDNSTVALTAGTIGTADLTNLAVTTGKIANDAVDNTKLDLTDDYALSGAVTLTGTTLLTDANIIANQGLALVEGTAPSTAASEVKMYTKDTSGEPEVFFRKESDGSEVQATSGTSMIGGGTATSQWAVKAWGNVTYTSGVPALGDSYNISSVADTATGRCTVNIDTDFANTNYVIVVTVRSASGDQHVVNVTGKAAGSFIVNYFALAGTLEDPDDTYGFDFMCIGD